MTNKKNLQQGPDIFGDVMTSKNESDFATLFESSLKNYTKKYEKGDKVIGQIITIGKDEVFVNIDGRDGVFPKSEITDSDGKLMQQIGESATLYITKTGGELLQLSTKPSSKALGETLEDAFDFETPVEGRVTEVTNGGYKVQILGKMAFCPISQIDLKPSTEPEKYLNRKFEFIITKYENKGKNIVVSRRKVLDQEKAESQGQFLQDHQIGDVVNGTVTRLESYGAFIELGAGLEGLLHISEISWTRIAHPSEALQLGQDVTAKIIKMDEDETGRIKISLSRKQVDENPWDHVAKEFPVGTLVTGKIREKERFGLLVEIKPGVVGLLPKSVLKESSMEKEIDAKKLGESIKLVVANVNPVDRRISLALPKDQDDLSWQEFSGGKTSGFGSLGDQLKGLFPGKK